jgi:hypothetical protein
MDAQALGRYLRESRETREILLEDAESTLHIRRRILEVFEQGDFDITGASPVQVRGFVRNYAAYLGLEPDLVVSYYDAVLQGGGRRGRSKRNAQAMVPVAPRAITDTNPSLPRVTLIDQDDQRWRNLLNLFLIAIGTVIAIGVIIFVIGEFLRPTDRPAQEPGDDDPGSQQGFLAQLPPTTTFTPIPTFTPLAPATELPRAQQLYDGQGVLVTIETVQRTWIRLLTDGVERFAGIAPPGMILEFEALNTITVNAANAEALKVIYNGQSQGSFGRRGQKVDIVFGLENMTVSSGPGFEPTLAQSLTPAPRPNSLAATLLFELTPTNTPGPSPTPTFTPSITLTPSDTPTPTDTPTSTLTPTNTPTNTPTSTDTPTPTITPTPTDTLTPTPTAILPPRFPLETHTPTKEGA